FSRGCLKINNKASVASKEPLPFGNNMLDAALLVFRTSKDVLGGYSPTKQALSYLLRAGAEPILIKIPAHFHHIDVLVLGLNKSPGQRFLLSPGPAPPLFPSPPPSPQLSPIPLLPTSPRPSPPHHPLPP